MKVCMDTKQTKPRHSSALNPNRAATHDRRRRNLEAALQCVYHEDLTSRAHIARLTGLTRATVSELISQLVAAGIVNEVGPGTSSGGKPPTLIELNAQGREIVALDLSRQPFRGALVDLAGTIRRRGVAGNGRATGEDGVRGASRLVATLLDAATAPVLGVGIGTPGIVDVDGSVVEAVNLRWHGVPLQQELAARYGLPVRVANDAHVAALAEFGSRHGTNLVVVKIGVGIGAGIVVNGSLYSGDRPAAGEIGHIRVTDNGARCTCGNSGCLETVASVPSILRRAALIAGREPSPDGSPAGDVDEIMAMLGRDAIRQAVAEAGRALGSVLAHMVAILDIHRIVIALEMPGYEDQLLDGLRAEVEARVLPDLASVVELSSTTRGPDLVIAGAAALVLRDQLGVVWR